MEIWSFERFQNIFNSQWPSEAYKYRDNCFNEDIEQITKWEQIEVEEKIKKSNKINKK